MCLPNHRNVSRGKGPVSWARIPTRCHFCTIKLSRALNCLASLLAFCILNVLNISYSSWADATICHSCFQWSQWCSSIFQQRAIRPLLSSSVSDPLRGVAPSRWAALRTSCGIGRYFQWLPWGTWPSKAGDVTWESKQMCPSAAQKYRRPQLWLRICQLQNSLNCLEEKVCKDQCCLSQTHLMDMFRHSNEESPMFTAQWGSDKSLLLFRSLYEDFRLSAPWDVAIQIRGPTTQWMPGNLVVRGIPHTSTRTFQNAIT